MKPKKKPARFVAKGDGVFLASSGILVASYWWQHPQPVQSARAEARRLNAWWARRKKVKR